MKGAWPGFVPVDSGLFSRRSYQLQKDGTPVFFYTYKGVDIRDDIHAAPSRQGLERQLTFTFHQPLKNLYLLAAAGGPIRELPDSSYAVDDSNYYIAGVQSDKRPLIVKSDAGYRLLIPIVARDGKATITYDLIW